MLNKVLVFGGTRFFGRDLVKKLIEDGFEVTIATRGRANDTFGDKVTRFIVDRNDRVGLERTLGEQQFDIVFDNLCYSPNAALLACEAFKGKIGKYILTSTQSVYGQGFDLKEEDYDPYHYPIRYGEREDFDYAEGKRLAEAVIFQNASFPAIAVRFPVVIGVDDYTKRLFSYVENTEKGNPFFVDNLQMAMSFISAREAGEFLAHIASTNFIGPINACCDGTIQIKDIIRICEERLSKRWIAAGKECHHVGAFNGFIEQTLGNRKAKQWGFQFEDLSKVVEELVEGYANTI